MGKLTISGATPNPELDGLSPLSDLILEHPTKLILLITVMSASWSKKSHDKGIQYPVMAHRHMEPVRNEQRAKLVAEILGQEYGDRTGKMTLLFEPGSDYDPDKAPSGDDTDEAGGASDGTLRLA